MNLAKSRLVELHTFLPRFCYPNETINLQVFARNNLKREAMKLTIEENRKTLVKNRVSHKHVKITLDLESFAAKLGSE